MPKQTLTKAVVFYADHTYLILFSPGDKVPNHAQLTFPVDLHRQSVFVFMIGQMPGISFDEADFEELVEIIVDDFPPSGDGLVQVQVEIDVRQDRAAYVQLSFSTDQAQDFYMPMYPLHGPLPLD